MTANPDPPSGSFPGLGHATDCRLFSGFSPCRFRRACPGCPHWDPIATRILLVVLDALGDVLRSTAVLPAIRRRHPRSHITWLTRAQSAPLLAHNPLVDRVLILGEATAAVLSALRFDVALCPEKSVPAGALMAIVRADEKRGFTVDEGGVIVPLGPSAGYLYGLGLDNEAKFFRNSRSEQQVVTEALGLPYQRDRYVVVLDDKERAWARDDRRAAGVGDTEVLVGWNTGCSPRYPYKKLLVPDQVRLMEMSWQTVQRRDRVRFALLGGGAEDEERNRAIGESLSTAGIPVTSATTRQGLRRGIASVAACDMVVTGDTLGLHMAIGLRKPVIVWFGSTCHQEIDLYGRGVKVLSTVPCRPCWLQSCHLEPKCYRELPWEVMAAAVAEMAETILRDGSWQGERLVGEFPPRHRSPPPLGVSPGPVL